MAMATPYLLHHLLESAAVADPSKEAVVDLTGGVAGARRSLTYEKFYGMAAHCSVVLQAAGLERCGKFCCEHGWRRFCRC